MLSGTIQGPGDLLVKPCQNSLRECLHCASFQETGLMVFDIRLGGASKLVFPVMAVGCGMLSFEVGFGSALSLKTYLCTQVFGT